MTAMATKTPADPAPTNGAVSRVEHAPASWGLGDGAAVPWEYAPAPESRDIVESALGYFAGNRYELRDQVVMPNHVHVIVTPFGEHALSSIVQSWKSFTAHKISKALRRRGQFWQKESFDHIVRGLDSLQKFRDYIDGNRKCRRDLQSRIS